MSRALQLYGLVVTGAILLTFTALFTALIQAFRPGHRPFVAKSTLNMVRRHRWEPRHVGVAR